MFNPSQMTNFKGFQTESLQTTISNLMNMAESSPKGYRKHCGKRRNCSLRAISPFPTVFSKDLYCRHVKTRACLERVKPFVPINIYIYHVVKLTPGNILIKER